MKGTVATSKTFCVEMTEAEAQSIVDYTNRNKDEFGSINGAQAKALYEIHMALVGAGISCGVHHEN